MTPRYKVTLTQEERGLLEALTRSGKTAAAKTARRVTPEEVMTRAAPCPTRGRNYGTE
jgi:hypothetical protein